MAKFICTAVISPLLLTHGGTKDTTPALAIANLTDPAKLKSIRGERAANPRLQKSVYWLAYANEKNLSLRVWQIN